MRARARGFVGSALALCAFFGCSSSRELVAKTRSDGPPANGDTGAGGGAGAGGASPIDAGGPQCLDPSGHVPASLKTCAVDAECGAFRIHRCCTNDLLAGLGPGKDCRLPDVAVCDQVGCLHPSAVEAEDGDTSAK